MAATIDPTAYIPSIALMSATTSGGGDPTVTGIPDTTKKYLVIAMEDLPELTEAELSGGAADMRKVMFALMSAFYDAYAGITAADRPAKWVASRATSYNDTSGVTSRNYLHQFSTETTGEEVTDE